jgi:hypothetical protein
MSKNYLELQQYFPELFETKDSPFDNQTLDDVKEFEDSLQIKFHFDEEKQTV